MRETPAQKLRREARNARRREARRRIKEAVLQADMAEFAIIMNQLRKDLIKARIIKRSRRA